jgi:hypothetical protein
MSEIPVASNPATRRDYYISTGRKSGFYTLRERYTEPVYTTGAYGTVETGMRERDHYIMTLTRDPETAVAKAQEYLKDIDPDAQLAATAQLRDISKSGDWSWFRGGKYEGATVDEVIAQDPNYALWAALSLSGKRFDKTVAILRDRLGQVYLDARAEQERLDAENEAATMRQQDAKQQRIMLLSEFVDLLDDREWGTFRSGVAEEMRVHGTLPRGRGRAIALDIVAKQMGRKGSKAFNVEREKWEEVFDQVEDLGG